MTAQGFTPASRNEKGFYRSGNQVVRLDGYTTKTVGDKQVRVVVLAKVISVGRHYITDRHLVVDTKTFFANWRKVHSHRNAQEVQL